MSEKEKQTHGDVGGETGAYMDSDRVIEFWEHHRDLIEYLVACGDIWYCGECGCAYIESDKDDARYDDDTNTLYCMDCWEQWPLECPNCGWWAKEGEGQGKLCLNCETPLVEHKQEDGG